MSLSEDALRQFDNSADFSIPERPVGRRSSDFATEPSPRA
jgi:hypothetical protein